MIKYKYLIMCNHVSFYDRQAVPRGEWHSGIAHHSTFGKKLGIRYVVRTSYFIIKINKNRQWHRELLVF